METDTPRDSVSPSGLQKLTDPERRRTPVPGVTAQGIGAAAGGAGSSVQQLRCRPQTSGWTVGSGTQPRAGGRQREPRGPARGGSGA